MVGIVTLTFRSELIRAMREESRAEGMTLNQWLSEILESYMEVNHQYQRVTKQ